MSAQSNGTAVLDPAAEGFEIEAGDVTGYQSMRVPLSPPGGAGMPLASPAGSVARALAARMRLPDDVPWILRDEATGSFLQEDRPIGDQLRPGCKVVLTPKAHLGGAL